MTPWAWLVAGVLVSGDGRVEPPVPNPLPPPVLIPIPVGDPSPPYRLAVEIGPGPWYRGTTVSFAHRPDDWVWKESARGRSASVRTSTRVWAGEWSQLLRNVRREHGRPTGLGVRCIVYVASRVSVKLDVEVTSRGVRSGVWLAYYPWEGVEVAFGWNPLTGRPVVRLAYGFEDWTDLIGLYLVLNPPKQLAPASGEADG
jgi:hypothetical protein